jgi:hypothetical protein
MKSLKVKNVGWKAFFQSSSNKSLTYHDWPDFSITDNQILPTVSNRSTPLNLLIYNRVPKCGSTTVLHIIHQCEWKNHFRVRTGPFNKFEKTVATEAKILLKLYQATHAQKISALVYHSHTYLLDARKFGIGQDLRPNLINVIREPLERQLSRIYYNYSRMLMTNQTVESFDLEHCLQNSNHSSCQLTPYDLQICFFAGSVPPCLGTILDSDRHELLQIAKWHVEHDYSVVGLTSQMDKNFQLFELFLPRFFNGASFIYKNESSYGENGEIRQNETPNKPKQVMTDTIKSLLLSHHEMMLELEFYQFVQQRFELQVKKYLT